MVLRVKAIGSGVKHDAYRVNLPSYRLILMDYEDMTALISVPDEVHGLTEDDLAHEVVRRTSEGSHYPEFCSDCVAKVHANLGKRYREHKGEYELEIAS
jgi:hypothetical protein